MKEYPKNVDITVNINDVEYRENVPANMTLLHFLREQLHLTGTKEGCGIGECGACTVILNGKPVTSCTVLAAEVDGAEIRTIEGEARNDKLTELQQAFIEYHGEQCGFCTPGFIMSAQSLLDRNPTPSHEEIIESISGNLCRCTGYEPIVQAIESVVRKKS